MSVQALQDYTFTSKYTHYLPEKKRRETWEEAQDRVLNMHLKRFPQIEEELRWAFQMAKDKKALGAQRALQFGGEEIEKCHAKNFNCWYSHCDRVDFFRYTLWLLLCGGGVGFSVQKHHIAQLPQLVSDENKRGESKTYVVEDSIEGWADALGALMSSYLEVDSPYYGYDLEFDYSEIRPEGAPVGPKKRKAPGPSGLAQSLSRIIDVLNGAQARGGQLKSIECYDIIAHASDAVLSGGIRRSALLVMFSKDDDEMINAKTGNWLVENPQRARSNNSVALLKSDTTFEEFQEIIQRTKEFGEPGFIWCDSQEGGFNPCFVDDTWVMTDQGPRQIKGLVGKQFAAMVNGEAWPSTEQGFFETGEQDVYEIETKEGYSVTCTDNHRFRVVVDKNGDSEWRELKDIQEGDQILVNDHGPLEWEGIGTKGQGWLVGNLIGDGSICNRQAILRYWGPSQDHMAEYAIGLLNSEELTTYQTITGSKSKYNKNMNITSVGLANFANRFGVRQHNKTITPEMEEQTSSEFCKGLISGLFDADGSVMGTQEKGCSIRLSNTDEPLLRSVQRMLLRLGIHSSLYLDRQPEGPRMLPDGQGGSKLYECKAGHELIISKDNIHKFNDTIGLSEPAKQHRINDIIQNYVRAPNKTKYIARFVKKTLVGKKKVYDCTINKIHAFDANGLYSHNCSEINFYCIDDETKKTGFMCCNLCEINAKVCKTEQDFYDACKAASIIGTVQAAYTNFDYLDETSRKLSRKEALLGVSMTGMMDSPEIVLDPEVQTKGAKIVVDINAEIAQKIGINPTARATAVKPAGSSSCVLGTSSGIHTAHSRRYIRRAQANKNESCLQFLESINPDCVETSVWSNTGDDKVVAFCVEASENAITKKDVSAIEFLEKVKLTQKHWVTSGRTQERCLQPWLNHNVSNTVTVKPEEWDEVTRYIYDNRQYFAGISLLAASGDKDYPQAPFTAVYTKEEIMGEYNLTEEEYGRISEFVERQEDIYALSNDILSDKNDSPLPFAPLFDSPKILTYCLKDIYNLQYWNKLQASYKPVDFMQMVEEEDNTKPQDEMGCAGGKCDLQYV